MRTLSSRKLEEVEALLERTQAMRAGSTWPRSAGCETPAECTLFPAPGQESTDAPLALTVVQVNGGSCRRKPA